MVGVSKGLADLEVGNSLADVHIGGVVLLILADSHWGGEHWGYSYSASLPPLAGDTTTTAVKRYAAEQ